MTGVIEWDLQRGKSFGVHKSAVKSSNFQSDDSWRRVQALMSDAHAPIALCMHGAEMLLYPEATWHRNRLEISLALRAEWPGEHPCELQNHTEKPHGELSTWGPQKGHFKATKQHWNLPTLNNKGRSSESSLE